MGEREREGGGRVTEAGGVGVRVSVLCMEEREERGGEGREER